MQKVVKFGGSSLANANQFKKVKAIIESDQSRNIVVVSALGKRNKEDHKITDLLYLTAAHLKYNVDAMSVFEIVKNRYYEVKEELQLDVDLDEEFKINIFKDKVNVVNYIDIVNFTTKEVTIKYNGGLLLIIGNNLSISRLLIDEVLVTGNIEKIELR